jgi:hypothetical protein
MPPAYDLVLECGGLVVVETIEPWFAGKNRIPDQCGLRLLLRVGAVP